MSRDERRRRTEAAILRAAREQFSVAGYERTTIRSVAAAASVDPALVMQYFGSKEGLFAEAARWDDDHQTVLQASREELPRAALADMLGKFEGDDTREAAVAFMRNCLTHPEANRIMRDEVMCDRAAGIAAILGGDDAELRAGLIGACMMGLGLSRYVFELPGVATASRADLERLMEPVLRALVDPPA
ncbi:MAG: transcriptional regulator, TetR family [Frankiales bacterium]|nr:transcriptional regulator, TetR family [Frankiales bacterium]